MKTLCQYGCAVVMMGIIACSVGLGAENAVQLVVRADAPGAKISPTMYGIFFEDINFGADDGLYVTAGREGKASEIILKVVNSAAQPIAADVQIKGAKRVVPQGTMIVLAGEKRTDENSIAEPRKAAPVTSTLKGTGSKFKHTFDPYSLTVLRLRTKD